MVQLSLGMLEHYEIPNRRPGRAQALLLGADRLMLGCAAPLLDAAGMGACCVCEAADALRVQDGMYTLLLRGEREDGGAIREECVIQSICQVCAPERDFAEIMAFAGADMQLLMMSADADAPSLALAARACYEAWRCRKTLPRLLIFSERPADDCVQARLRAMAAIARGWHGGAEFAAALSNADAQAVLAGRLCGPLNVSERAAAQREMNYRDDFIAWAEPENVCIFEYGAPEDLKCAAGNADYEAARIARTRVFDALVFLCAGLGYLAGRRSFADVLDDEALRGFIGRTFTQEIMPALPLPKEQATQAVISAFSRLENHQNDMPLLEIGGGLLGGMPRSVLPAIRAYAEREFDAPKRLTLALAAAVMLYAGARLNAGGQWEVARGEELSPIYDEAEVLALFSTLAHDMPAETLAYAVLADRSLWGEDLREIPGLEMRMCFDISAIQRAGLMETLRRVDRDDE